MDASRRQFVASAVAATALGSSEMATAAIPVVSPEMFGARGDGRTNDTMAFAAMSAHVNAHGGGTIVLRPRVYLVGRQERGSAQSDVSFKPWDLIHLIGCSQPISIRGNGATLRCAPGLYYGRFDARSGGALPDVVKFDLSGNATPYTGMIHIEHSSGGITITDLELDGEVRRLIVGGKTSNAGWLAGGTGIRLVNNSGSERISRVHSHHHAQDGLILTASGDRRGSTIVSDVTCEYNGRQGCSITGGHRYLLQRCRFRHTGRTPIKSAPGAGVDIEAESSPIRNVTFADCEFSDNSGFGLVSGSGDSANILAQNCRFIGTTNLAAWPESPGMRFEKCLFVGSVNHVYGARGAAGAAQFADCVFTDDPQSSPTGKVFLQGGNAIAIVPPDSTVSFDRCQFRLVGKGLLPSGGPRVLYQDCSFSQRSLVQVAVRGTYTGTNSIVGNVIVRDPVVRGQLTVNGAIVP